jgi:bifunctional NMN adenylyltransferase/nudix hydrolase
MANEKIRSTLTSRTPSRKRRVAVYIGRLQGFHLGQAHVIEHCAFYYDETLVLIGSAFKARDPKDPFTFTERKGVVQKWASTRGIGDRLMFRPVRDRPYNDAAWIAAVQEQVSEVFNPNVYDITLVGCDRDESTWYLKAFPQWGRDLIEPFHGAPGLSATRIRERLFTDDEPQITTWNEITPATQQFLLDFCGTEEFHLLKQQYAWLKQYHADHEKGVHPAQYVCADAFVIQSGHVLVQRRAHLWGRGLLTTSGGGFVKPRARIKDTAITETLEETGIRLAEGKRAKEITHDMLKGNIVDHEYFDHPDLSLRGRFFVHAYLIRLNDSKPLPKVGAQMIPEEDRGDHDTGKHPDGLESLDAWWMPLHQALAQPELWFEHSYHMLETFAARLKD